MKTLATLTLALPLAACSSTGPPPSDDSSAYDVSLPPTPGWSTPYRADLVQALFGGGAEQAAWFVQGEIAPPLSNQQYASFAAALPLDEQGRRVGPALVGSDLLGGAGGASFTAYAKRSAVPEGAYRLALIYEREDDSLVSVPLRIRVPR